MQIGIGTRAFALVVTLLCAIGSAHAATVINDTFIGAQRTVSNGVYGGGTASGTAGDIIGSASVFGISSAEFDRTGDDLSVKVNTGYAGRPGTGPAQGTTYGSLFLGAGTIAPAPSDDFSDMHSSFTHAVYLPSNAATASDVGTSVYAIPTGTGTYGDSGAVRLSEANNGLVFRSGQAVNIDTGATGVTNAGSAKYSIDPSNDYIEFVIADFFTIGGLSNSLTDAGGNMVFGWAMSCANDIIVGTVSLASFTTPVPLPAGFVLLLSGLLGLGWLGRSRTKQA